MPKKVNLVPNLRLDIPDLTQQTVGLSVEGQKQLVERLVLDNYPTTLDGFRIQVVNAANKQISVYNGVAFDRSGQIINNEDDYAARRDHTFLVDGTYYVEVTYAETTSDVGARGFWNPTYSNGSDPSGDTRPRGREFTDNVSTRITPDWQIVSPVSTSGFEIDTTNLNSTKIPVGVVVVSGGSIIGTTHTISSVLLVEANASSTKVYLTSSREMGDAFTLTLSPGTVISETVSVTANDRENGALTLSASPVNTHAAGSRAIVSGTSFLIPQLTGTRDSRSMLFSGDVRKGYYLSLDPNSTDDARVDTQLKSLKNYVDFLASQLSEMKFGASESSTIGTKAPPSSFSGQTNYYSPTCGIVPSRTATITIGDGVNSFGDFNSNVVSADDAFSKAFSYLNTQGGGTLFVKNGTYSLTSALSATTGVSIRIIGESKTHTIINPSNSSATVTRTTELVLENLTWAPVSTGTITSCFIGTGILKVYNCIIGGVGGVLYPYSYFNSTSIYNSVKPLNVTTMSGVLFDNVHFTRSGSAVSGDSIVTAGVAGNVTFRNCTFSSSASNAATIGVNINSTDTTNGADNIHIDSCVFEHASGYAPTTVLNISKATTCSVKNCNVKTGSTSTGVFLKSTPANIDVSVNTITCDAGASSTSSKGIVLDGCSSGTIDNNAITDCVIGIYGTASSTISKTNITNNTSTNTTTLGVNLYGILIESTCTKTEISSNNFNSLQTTSTKTVGVDLSTSPGVSEVIIKNNQCDTLSATTDVAGIVLQSVSNSIISNNLITSVTQTSSGVDATCYGILANTCTDVSFLGNQILGLGYTGLGTANSVCSGITLTGTLKYNVVKDNQIRTIGNNSSVSTGISAIHCLPGTDSTQLDISDNSIRTIQSAFSIPVAAIGIATNITVLDVVTVNNNIIDAENPSCNSISCINTVGSILNSSVLGNTIATGFHGITILATDVLSSTLVNDNNVSLSFSATHNVAIAVTGGTLLLTPQVTIKGNTINCPYQGIAVFGVSNLVSGNSVYINSDTANNAGIIVNKKWFNIIGNTVVYSGYSYASSCCIDTTSVPSTAYPGHVLGTITSNSCYYGTGATTNHVLSHGIRLPTTEGTSFTIVYANICGPINSLPWSSGDGFAIEQNGSAYAGVGSQATSDTESNAPTTVPSGWGDIGLNFRSHGV